jgi:uncharacterized protein
VDVGVHQDGLVHVSELADRFVRDPAEVVKVQQKVTVTVLEVDLTRKRIRLSMRNSPKPAKAAPTGATAPTALKAQAPTNPKGKKPTPQARQPFHNPLAEALGKLKKK